MQETMSRALFRGYGVEHYITLLHSIPNIARLYVAEVEGKPVSWIISTEYRDFSIYLYGAGNALGRETYAAFALQWFTMKDLRSRGNTVYDMTGISSENYKGLENVTQFKLGFSKWIVDLPVMRDIPLNTLKYKALTTAINVRRRIKHPDGTR
jgi:lipid II:glycine glycyltransferase (peptidoglycan interpeptide bridge formation enzyme)